MFEKYRVRVSVGKYIVLLGLTLFSALRVQGESINIALNKSVTADQSNPSYPPGNTVDGSTTVNNFWSAGTWGTASSPISLTLDLGKNESIKYVSLCGAYTGGKYEGNYVNYNLYYQADGATGWTFVGSGTLTDTTDPYGRWDEWSFNNTAMRKVKYEVTGGTHYASLSELEVYAPIPEPSVAALVGLFGGGLFAVRRIFLI